MPEEPAAWLLLVWAGRAVEAIGGGDASGVASAHLQCVRRCRWAVDVAAAAVVMIMGSWTLGQPSHLLPLPLQPATKQATWLTGM